MKNPQTMQDVEKIVLAGMKLMYAPQTRQMMNSVVNSEGPLPEGLSSNIIGLVQILWEKSNGTLPPEAIGPATMILVYEMASFIRDAGKEVDPEEVDIAAQMAMQMLKELFQQIGPQEQGGQQGMQGQGMQPKGNMQQSAMPQQGGLISRGM